MTEERIIHCRKLKRDLPGLKRQPYRNELGRRLYEEVSQDAWDMWLKDSVKYINTYCGAGSKYDLATSEGQKFMFDQVAIYFGFEAGELAKTAFVPKEASK
ncbi:MAG: Fe(2+)-trafficking protein [Polyangiaceae bacterium]